MRKSVLGAVGLLVTLASVGVSVAEDKKPKIEKTSASGAPLAQYGMRVKVYVDAPRTTWEMEEAERQVIKASRNICDYTDGQFYLSEVEFVGSPADKKDADVWWRQQTWTSVSGHDLGDVTEKYTKTCDATKFDVDKGDRGRCTMYSALKGGTNELVFKGEVFSHELGHLIFGMSDEYRRSNMPIPTGIGTIGFRQVENPYTGKLMFRSMGGTDFTYKPAALDEKALGDADDVGPLGFNGLPLYPPSTDGAPWWKTHLGVMQQTHMGTCRNSANRTPYDIDPILNSATGCRIDDECADLTGIYVSPKVGKDSYSQCLIAQTSSEATLYDNLELNTYRAALGESVTIDLGGTRVREAGELVLQGLLVPSVYEDNIASPPTRHVAALPSSWPSVTPGTANDEFLCDNDGAGLAACPMAAVPGNRNQSDPNKAWCLGRVPVNTSDCLPSFSRSQCGDGDIDGDATMGEQCDNGVGRVIDESTPLVIPLGLPGAGNTLTCDNVFSFWRVLHQSGTTADDTRPSIRFTNNANVHCRANCTLDLSRCTPPLGESLGDTIPAGTTLDELQDKSDKMLWAEFYDRDGKAYRTPKVVDTDTELKVDFDKVGPSSHVVFAFMKRVGRLRSDGIPAAETDPNLHDIWEVLFAMDAAEFKGGTAGEAHHLKTIRIEFSNEVGSNKGVVLKADGVPYTGTLADLIVIPKGSLTRGLTSDDIKLGLNLDNLDSVRTEKTEVGTRGIYTSIAGRSHLYARHRVVSYKGQDIEVPQYASPEYRYIAIKAEENGGSCDSDCEKEAKLEAKIYEFVNYNPLTKRSDTPRSTLDRLTGNEALKTAVEKNDVAAAKKILSDLAKMPDGVSNTDDLKGYILSGWDNIEKEMCSRFGIQILKPEFPDQIKGKEPTCPATDVKKLASTSDKWDANSQVVLVLDRSGSMSADSGEKWDGKPASRLDYVKAAGLELVSNMSWYVQESYVGPTPALDARAPQLGLVWFSDNAEPKFPLASSDACTKGSDCATGVCLSDGKCRAPMPRLDCNSYPDYQDDGYTKLLDPKDPNYPYEGDTSSPLSKCPSNLNPGAMSKVTDVISETFLRVREMSLTGSPWPVAPAPQGWTGTGSAVEAAGQLFDLDNQSAKRFLVLLTDGFQNRPTGAGDLCEDGSPYRSEESCWPSKMATDKYDLAIKALPPNTTVYSVPLGVSGDRASKRIAEGTLEGEVFQTQRNFGEDTIPAFAEVHAAMRGQSVLRAGDSLPIIRVDHYSSPEEYELPVEVGADALHVTVSNYDAAADDFSETVKSVRLVSPAGQVVPNTKGDVGTLSARFHVRTPLQGTWKLVDGSWQGTDIPKRHRRLYVTAAVDNPEPLCEADTNLRVSDGTQPIKLRAKASTERPIVSGASYTAMLQRPDMTIVELGLTPSGTEEPANVEIGPSQYTGDGLYIATVTCTVAEGAKLLRAEAPPPDGDEPVEREPQLTSHAFTRQVRAYFHVRGSGAIAIPGLGGDNQDQSILEDRGLPPGYSPVKPFIGDTDGDGIKNEDEPDVWIDSDNDKKPDVNDPDSNSNEIPDGVDPAIPYSPAADGTGSHCKLSNSATCCASLGNCVGALPTVAVYADGNLSLRDRAVVETAGSGRATIVNAGTDVTELGVNAKAGNVLSGGTIHLNAGASIAGYAKTASTITLDAGANQPVPAYQNATIGFQPLSSFSVTIPSGGALAEVGGGQSRPIAPGTYGDLRIQPNGTAYLSSGTYYVQSLDLEPQAILALDMSSGPIYLYVANSVIYRGSIITTAGKSSDLFVGYMGTQTAALERPFTGTFVAPQATLLIGPPSGGALFSGSFYAADVEVRPDVVIEAVPFGHVWLSSSSTGGGTGGGSTGGGGSGSFTCTGACLSATPISRYQFSGNFNTTSEVWFVTSEVPNGWQASNVQGRQILVNGVTVTAGQMPLPAPVGGKYYFQFTSGGVAWANWSFW